MLKTLFIRTCVALVVLTVLCSALPHHKKETGDDEASEKRGWPVRYMAGGGLMEIKRNRFAEAEAEADIERAMLQRMMKLYRARLESRLQE